MDINLIAGILGWTSNVCFVVGAYDFSKKHINGFYWNTLANFLYMIQTFFIPNPPLFWLSLILIGINIKGILKWLKDS